MSFAIVVYSSEMVATGLYIIQRNFGLPVSYSTDSRREAVEMADSAARTYSSRFPNPVFYAVYDIGRDDVSPGELRSSRPWVAWGQPVYVPALCERLAHWLGASPLVPHRFGLAPAPSLSDPWAYVLDAADTDGGNTQAIDLDVGCDAPIVVAAPVSAPPPVPSVRFEVRSGLNGTDRNAWSSVADFDNGREAAAYVSTSKASFAANGKSLVIVKVEVEAQAIDWREREALRMTDGTYQPLPGNWAEVISSVYPDHFPHVAQSDKRKIAFTESASSGERDKQKVLSAGAYVLRFFDGGEGFWYSDARSQFCADMLGSSLKALFAPLGDVEALVKVYRDCEGGNAHGCMSYGLGSFSSHIHPVSVYALGGEITVALLRGYGEGEVPEGESSHAINTDATWDSSGPVLARCLVWERDGEVKGFGRLYGNSEYTRALKMSLEALGYSNDDCHGAKIAKVESEGEGDFVMPYLDIGGGNVDDCGDYFIAGGEIDAQRTDGVMSLCDTIECEHCGNDYDEDEMRNVLTGRHDNETWCYGCCDSSASYCHHSEEYVSDDSVVAYRASGSAYVVTVAEWLIGGAINAVLCDDDDTYYEGGFYCSDCSEGQSPDCMNVWGDRETGKSFQDEGDMLCASCYSARTEAADALEAATNETEAA